MKRFFQPFSWVSKKIRDGFQYIFIDKTNKVFLVLIPNFLFSIFGLSIITYNFKNLKEDTTSLTNIGFAILVGLASVCFSWARGLTKNEEIEILQRVTKAGESFLHCAIIFLLLSAIKYSILQLEILIPKNWNIFYWTIYSLLSFIHGFGFTLGFYKVDRVISDVNKLLYERLHK